MTDAIKTDRPPVIRIQIKDREGYVGQMRYIERKHIISVFYSPVSGALQLTLTSFQMQFGPDMINDLNEAGEPKKWVKNTAGKEVPRQKEVPFTGWGQSEVIGFEDESIITDFMRQYDPETIVEDPDKPGEFLYEGLIIRKQQLVKWQELQKKLAEESEQAAKEKKEKEDEAQKQLDLMREQKRHNQEQEEGKVVSMETSPNN
jgi:hypothetical protein